MNNWNCLRIRRFNAKDKKASSTGPESTVPTPTLPPPLTAQGCRHSPAPTAPSHPAGNTSTLERLLPPAGPSSGDRASDTYIPLDECYSGSRPMTQYSQSATASPQVGMRAVQPSTVHHQKSSTLGSDVFLLDIVPPSPYRSPQILHTKSRSYDRRDSVGDREAGLRPVPIKGRVGGDSSPSWPTGPTLPPRHVLMSPSSPTSPPCLQPRESYYNGVSNAGFVHPDPVRCEATPKRPVGAGPVKTPINHRVPLSPSSVSGDSFNYSPMTGRCRDLELGLPRATGPGTRHVSSGGLRDGEYGLGHPPALPPPPPVPLSCGEGCMELDDDWQEALDERVSRPAGLRGPLSLSTGVLNFSPPAPHLTPSQVKLHRYMNAGAVTVVQTSSSHHHPAGPHRSLQSSGVGVTASTLPARCRNAAPPRDTEPYYNDDASPVLLPSRRLDYCNSSDCNVPCSPQTERGTVHRTPHLTDGIPLPIKKYKNVDDLDSSTDDDDDSGADWHSSHTVDSSTTSLDHFVHLVGPMTSSVTQSNDVINYLTLDLDQPVDAASSDRDRSEVDSVQRPSWHPVGSSTVYGDIDWFRTQALNDMRRQVETDRQNSTGSGCLVAMYK